MDIKVLIIVLLLISQVFLLLIIKQKNYKINKIMKLYETGRKIASSIKLSKLMKEIIQITQEELGAEAGSLYLIDHEKQELWFEVALGEKGDKIKEIRLKMGEGIAGKVAQEGITLNIKDANKSAYFKKDISEKIDFKQKAMLTMPVIFKEQTIAVIQLINKKNGKFFTKNDEELLEGIAANIAVALENAKLFDNVKRQSMDFINVLTSAIDAKDPYTNGHSKRVTEYSLNIGKAMGLDEEKLENLKYLAILHDVGKIGIKDSILGKEAPLSDEEFSIMKTHTLIGEKILGEMNSLKSMVIGAKYHHEKYNGKGYTENLKGEEIPLEARIIAVADTYDAMTTDRPYRRGLDHNVAVEEINRCSGTQFDPEIVKYFNLAMNSK